VNGREFYVREIGEGARASEAMADAISRIEKRGNRLRGKRRARREVKPSPLVVDLQSSSQLSADELLERFRRYCGNGLFASLCAALSFRFLPFSRSSFRFSPPPLPLSLSVAPTTPAEQLCTSRREPRRYLHVSVARETKNYYLYALVGGGGFCSSQTKLAATTPRLGLEVLLLDGSRG